MRFNVYQVIKISVVAASLLSLNKVVNAEEVVSAPFDDFKSLPFYVGGGIGYGSTDWAPVSSAHASFIPLEFELPLEAKDSGLLKTLFFGYHVLPQIAIEARYQRYPMTTVYFSKLAEKEYPELAGSTHMDSDTSSLALIAKYFVQFSPQYKITSYADLGGTYIFRQDLIAKISRLTPTFGLGVNYNFTPSIQSAIEFNYTAGYDTAVENPVRSYIPFLYAVEFRLIYGFNFHCFLSCS